MPPAPLPWPWSDATNYGWNNHGHSGPWGIPENTPVDTQLRSFVFFYTGGMVAARSRNAGQPKRMTVAGYAPRMPEAFWLALEIARNRDEWDLNREGHFRPNDPRSGCPDWLIHGGQADRRRIQLTQPNLRWRRWIMQDECGWRLSPLINGIIGRVRRRRW